MGKPDLEAINILLAHNPKYEEPISAEADLDSLSGHYHEQVCSVFLQTSSRSHQFPVYILFQKYCAAIFTKMAKCMIVRQALGNCSASSDL